jgi:uncharacterized protein YneR
MLLEERIWRFVTWLLEGSELFYVDRMERYMSTTYHVDGRGLLSPDEKFVYTWDMDEMAHVEKARELGYNLSKCICFYIRQGGKIAIDHSFGVGARGNNPENLTDDQMLKKVNAAIKRANRPRRRISRTGTTTMMAANMMMGGVPHSLHHLVDLKKALDHHDAKKVCGYQGCKNHSDPRSLLGLCKDHYR